MFLLVHSTRTKKRGRVIGVYTQRKLLWELIESREPSEMWTSTINGADGSLNRSKPYNASYAVLCRLLLSNDRVHVRCDGRESVFLIEAVAKNPRSV